MHTHSPILLSILTGLLTVACSSSPQEESSRDTIAPQVIVTSPERGTTSSAETVIVEGLASDDDSGIATVTISGVPATVHADGTFSAEIALADGLNLLKIVATDRSGNEAQSTRAVLSGNFAPASEPVKDAAQVYIGQETLAAVGDTSEVILDGLDIDALLASANPVLVKGTSNCLNAAVDLDQVSYDDLQVDLASVDDGIRAVVTISGLQADATANHEIACISGSTSIDIAVDEVAIAAELEIAVTGGALTAYVVSSTATMDNLTVDVGILPSSVIEFVVGDLDRKLGEKLSDLMAEELPPIVERNIAKLGVEREIQLLGNPMSVAVTPSAVDFDKDGGTLYLETHIASGSSGSPYISTPMPFPALQTQLGLNIAIADDALNQALSALWDTGALDRSIELTSESGADIGGGILNRVQLRAPLPPVIGADSGDGTLKLAIGDLLIDLLKDGEEGAVSQIAVSLEMDIHVEVVGNELKLRTDAEPTIYMDRLDTDGFLDERDLEILVAFASTMLAGDLDKLLGEIPLPSYSGTGIANAAVEARSGYLQVGANLVR